MNGIALIAEQIRKNRENKGYTARHDDAHDRGELIAAALCYIDEAAMRGLIYAEPVYDIGHAIPPWPFEPESWRPSDDPIRNLVHAGALIVAEIERLQRRKL